MTHFRKILLVTDGHERGREAFKRAADVASRNNANLTVIGVVKNSSIIALTGHKTLSLDDVQQRLIHERLFRIEKMRNSIANVTSHANTKILLGGGIDEIVQEVARNDHDLVIKAAEGWAGLNTPWFGNNDMLLTRKCPCPVWIVKPTPGLRYERILAAVDTNLIESKRVELNYLIMDAATAIAQQEDSDLHVVHAWQLRRENSMTMRVAHSDLALRAVRRELRRQHRVALEELLARYKGSGVRMHTCLTHGRADMVIARQASRHDVALIVMGTLDRAGSLGLIAGSTTENVLNQVTCSVLTVKPQGFDTPVKLAS